MFSFSAISSCYDTDGGFQDMRRCYAFARRAIAIRARDADMLMQLRADADMPCRRAITRYEDAAAR